MDNIFHTEKWYYKYKYNRNCQYNCKFSICLETIDPGVVFGGPCSSVDCRFFLFFRGRNQQADIQTAFIKVGIGAEKHSRVISEKEKKITAYHESGHALLFHLLPEYLTGNMWNISDKDLYRYRSQNVSHNCDMLLSYVFSLVFKMYSAICFIIPNLEGKSYWENV